MADLPCPSCGTTLTYIEQYHRLYCPRCGQYAPEGYGEQGAQHCPTCGGILSLVAEYGRLYCYKCNAYSPSAPTAPSKAESESTPVAMQDQGPAPVGPAPVPVEATPSTPAASSPERAEAPPTPAAGEGTPAIPEASVQPTPAETPRVEPSAGTMALAASKPAVVRVKVYTLKKSELTELCAAYHLDASGTKDQLQTRILQFLHDLEEKEPAAGSEEPTPPSEPVPSITIVPEGEKTDSTAQPSSASEGAGQATSLVQVEEPEAKPQEAAAVEASPAPAVLVSAAAAPVAAATSAVVPAVAHPCPTCGRELTFISQYNRYYCYPCQRYAPAAQSKNACPTCGKSMRWIDQYQRWWCDACRKYGPADLPRPSESVVAKTAAAAATATQTAPRRAMSAHVHHSPGSGLGLIGFGLALFVIVEFFTVLAPLANLDVGRPFTAEMAALTQFFAFVFVAVGTLLAIAALRDRP